MSTLMMVLIAALNFLVFDISYTRFVRRRLKSGNTKLRYVVLIMITLLTFEGIYFYYKYGLSNTITNYEITTSADSMNFEVTSDNNIQDEVTSSSITE